jgi:diguanylate cyclase
MNQIEDIIQIVLSNFTDKYLNKKNTLHNLTNISHRVINDLYKIIIRNLLERKYESIAELIKPLSDIYVGLNIPYEEFKNELIFLQRSLFKAVLEKNDSKRALELLNIFDDIDLFVTQEFLNKHLNNIIDNNNLKLKTIETSIQDAMLKYYEAHVKWVNDLALSILHADISLLPEMCHNSCEFGIWLDSDDSREVITNTNDYLNMYDIHKKLHHIAQEIKPLLSQKSNHTHSFLTYISKAEDISRTIGMKLSTLSNEITKEQATKDPLTGVLNRELLSKLFEKELDLHATTNSSVLFAVCDLDHFKNVNDTYGHIAGDKVLQAFASLLKEQLRATDIIIRYGGEEFIIMIPNANLFQGVQILDNLRKKLKKLTIYYEEHKIRVTVSIGLVELKPNAQEIEKENIDDLLEATIKKADELLYNAKKNGRNRIEV